MAGPLKPDRPRNLVFGEDAEAYDASRPTYPAAAVDLLVQDGPADAVDVGCGTGKAARLVAARGVTVLGLEPDPRMAEVARRHGIPVVVSTIEAWEPTPCDLLYAAQAWHWVDATVGAERAADALRPGGRWAAIWNDELDGEVMQTTREVYAALAPVLIVDRGRHDDGEMFLAIRAAMASRPFEPVVDAEVSWAEEVDAATFVQRLSTHSSHRLLDRPTAHRLHAGLLDALGGPSARLTIPYRVQVLTTTRRG